MKTTLNGPTHRQLSEAKNYKEVDAITREMRENIKGHIDNDGFIYL